MECPKCHSIIDDDSKACPHCHKVFMLECPNCHSLVERNVCDNCGYTILTKCAKCSKVNLISNGACSKCGFSLDSSLAYIECENDDFACITFKIESLKQIKKHFKTKEMYEKFRNRIKNLLALILKEHEGKIINYGDATVINFNKELSFSTSANKAIRTSVKILNAFAKLNLSVQEEFSIPLKLNLLIIKKRAEDLQRFVEHNSNVKLLGTGKNQPKFLKDMQVVMDQATRDEIYKDFKTDSLYTVEENSETITYYSLLLDSYVLPPEKEDDDIVPTSNKVKITKPTNERKKETSFNVFDIRANCSFETIETTELVNKLSNLDIDKVKILSIRSTEKYSINTSDIAKVYDKKGYRVLSVSCTDQLSYKPWGVLDAIFKDYYNLSCCNKFNTSVKVNQNEYESFKPLFELGFEISAPATTQEDSRFLYFEHYANFLCTLKNTVIIIENFEKIDDTTIQALDLFFDNFKKYIPAFVFITSDKVAVHSKLKKLLRTDMYKEFFLEPSSFDSMLLTLDIDTSEFIKSFHCENIRENCNGSYLYFQNAIAHLKEAGAVKVFENKLLVKENKAVVINNTLDMLYKDRIKLLNKIPEVSMIVAYSTILGARIDFNTLKLLGIKNVEESAKHLQEISLARVIDEVLYINNYTIVSKAAKQLIKKENYAMLLKNVLAQTGKNVGSVILAKIMHELETYKEEYLLRWKLSKFAIGVGDYDAYLKNSLATLTLIDELKNIISDEELDANKKEIYNNVLSCLYSYSPAKVYNIGNILLIDAIEQNDDERIIKLSNMMLQGALLSSNYSEAIGLLHNILSRLKNATLVVDGSINTKFLLLSLVSIEILYNIGHYRRCVDTATEILHVLNKNVIELSKPATFSMDMYLSHLLESFRLAAFAKLFMLDEDLNDFLDEIELKFGVRLDEQACILAVKDFFEGNDLNVANLQESSPYAKIVYLILQEFSNLKDSYKTFAQNIYQAKLLAADISQKELELLCDLLIAYAYSQIGMEEKASSIYDDIATTSDKSSLFNIILACKYVRALQMYKLNNPEQALLFINDSFVLMQQKDNPFKLLYVLFEKLYIEIAEKYKITAIDIESEKNKLEQYKQSFSRFLI